jgi:hypothetical protein
MPTEAAASIHMNAGSVDITTESSPNINVASISDAVCLVGKFSSYTPPSQINTTQHGNNTVMYHRAVLECSSTEACRQPKWQVFAGSESSSIGIQALNSAGAIVHSGAAFKVCEIAFVEARSRSRSHAASIVLDSFRTGLV